MQVPAMEKFFALRTSNGQEYPIRGPIQIGRAEDCLIRYNHAAVSRHHARVWPAQGGLWVSDNHSANGLFINHTRLAPGQAHPLQLGDRLQLGGYEIELLVVLLPGPAMQPVQPGYPGQHGYPGTPGYSGGPGPTGPTGQYPVTPVGSTQRRISPLLLAGMTGCLVLAVLAALVAAYALFGREAPALPTRTAQVQSQDGAQVLSVAAPAPLLQPAEYLQAGQSLAQAVTELNQAELALIAAAGQARLPAHRALLLPAQAALDTELRQVAAQAMRVAVLADSLSRTAAAQDGGSDAAALLAGQYASVTQLGAALALSAQDLRSELAAGNISPQTAAVVVAGLGARLWNPAASPDGASNPFSASLPDPASIPTAQMLPQEDIAKLAQPAGSGGLSTWVAVSAARVSLSFNVPAFAGVTTTPQSLASLSTPEGQVDAGAARQAAAALLRASQPAAADPGQVTAVFFSAAAVSAPQDPAVTPSRSLPVFPPGTASSVSQPADGDIVSTLLNLDGVNPPAVVAQVPVDETQPLVNLTLSNITITHVNQKPQGVYRSFEADVLFEFDVTWNSNLVSPQFDLDCVGSNHFNITSASGSQHGSARGLLILYPGAQDVYCYASRNGATWGGASVQILVGDSAGATQRAVQVETDSASLNLTLTADVLGTLAEQTARAGATQTSLAVENAVSTEVAASQTAEFSALITEIARQTLAAPTPAPSDTPLPTATFIPVLVETLFHRGDEFAVSGTYRLQPGRLYRVCLSGTVNLTTGPARPSDLESVNGIKVPLSNCVVLSGDGSVVTVTCGSGVAADPPGGFTVQVYDLGPD